MPTDPLCANCNHHPHPNRTCTIESVSGPASTTGHDTPNGYDHGGRTVTPCGCPVYAPKINGHQLPQPERTR